MMADGGEAIALPLDVTDADSVKSFVHGATEALGDIDEPQDLIEYAATLAPR